MVVPGTVYGGRQKVTLIPGDGIGQELCSAVKTVFKACNVPIEWEQFDLSGYGEGVKDDLIMKQAMESLKRTKVGLKGWLMSFFFQKKNGGREKGEGKKSIPFHVFNSSLIVPTNFAS